MLQMKGSEGLVHPMADGLLEQAMVFKAKGHFIGAVYGKKLTSRILKNRGGPLADLADAHPCGVLPVQAAKALPLSLVKLWDQSVDAPQQCGFSASAASAEHHAASGWDAAADFLQGGLLFFCILKFKFKIYHYKLFSRQLAVSNWRP